MMKKLFAILALLTCACMICAAAAAEAVLPDEAALAAKAEQVLDYLDLSGADEYERIFGVYNYICQTVTYDWDAAGATGWDGVSIGFGQTAYEALCQEKAVCAGIARAITLLLEELNVPCKTVLGMQGDIRHAWNLVQLDGQWYFLDATSDLGADPYTSFLKCWDDMTDYVVSSESGFDIFDFNLASVSRVSSVPAALDSYAGFTFNVGLGDITIHSYTGTEADLVIPAEINGRKVRCLSRYCILENCYVETLVISEGIEEICSEFAGSCPYLRSIAIPSTAKQLSGTSDTVVSGLGGFVDSCDALETITLAAGNPYLCLADNVLYDKDMTEILCYPARKKDVAFRIPESVTRIQDSTFQNNPYLQEVIIPDGVTYIGYWAFNGCGSLKKANIPTACEVIGQYAFKGTQLAEVHIPAGMREIRPTAFSSTLRSITVDADNARYYAVDNVLYSRDGWIIAYAALKPETSFTIPDDVTTIVMHAFDHAANLKEVIFHDGVSVIEHGAFYGCSGLEEIALPDSLTELNGSVFFDCTALAKIVIPPSVKTMADGFIFANNPGVIIYGEAGSTAQEWAEEYGYLFHEIGAPWDVGGTCGEDLEWTLSEDGVLRIWGSGEMAVGSDGDMPWAPYYQFVREIIVGEGVTAMTAHAFHDMRKAVSVTLPGSLSAIPEYTFRACTALREIDIPESVTRIGYYAFWDCRSLQRAIIRAAAVEDIADAAFEDCQPVIYGVLGSGSDSWAAGYGYRFLPVELLEGRLPDNFREHLRVLELPAQVTTVEAEAFMNLPVQVIIVPDSCRSIGPRAFAGCEELLYVRLPEGAEAAEDAFEGSRDVYFAVE